MITRKKTRMAGVALMCAAAWTAVSCEMNATVDADHEPVLQIDAVFYSDEAMPVIRVRQSFHTARKGGKFLVEKEALEISGADIELLRNGEPVSVTEESPGHYQPDTEIIVEAGDHFEIHVHKDGMQASALAAVPDHPIDRIAITTDEVVDAVWGRGDVPVQFHFPFMPEFTAIRIYSEEDTDDAEQSNLWLNGGGNVNYRSYYASDHAGEDELSITHSLRLQFPANEEDIDQQRTILFPFYVDMVIPEPIYETWHRHKFNYGDFTPLTVTNVEGGVGLFIGAVRVHYFIEAELTIHFRRSDWEG